VVVAEKKRQSRSQNGKPRLRETGGVASSTRGSTFPRSYMRSSVARPTRSYNPGQRHPAGVRAACRSGRFRTVTAKRKGEKYSCG
jgi:hypothetical protein